MVSTRRASNVKRLVQKTIKAHKRRGFADGGDTSDAPDAPPAPPAPAGAFDYVNPTIAKAVTDIGTLPKRAIEASQESALHHYGPGPSTMSSDEEWHDPLPAVAGEAALTLGGMGMTGAETGAAGIFGGKLMRTADDAARSRAMRMERQGADLDDIHAQTGISKGADGQWRQEIDDSKSKIKLTGFDPSPVAKKVDGKYVGTYAPKEGATPLQDAFHHPELYEAYPDQLKDVTVNSMPAEMKAKGWLGAQAGNKIWLADDLTSDEYRTVLLHEIQHRVQDIEGFAKGDNPRRGLPEGWGDVKDEFQKVKTAAEKKTADDLKANPTDINIMKQVIRNELYGTDITWQNKTHIAAAQRILAQNPDVKNRLATIVKSEKQIDDTEADAYSAYNRTMGEVESRNAEKRRNLTAKQRREYTPEETEDVPRYLQRNSGHAAGGAVGYAAGGGLSFDDIPDAAAPPAAAGGLSFDDIPDAEPPSLMHRATEGVKSLARGAEDFGGVLGEAVMGPFGPQHTLHNLKADLGFGGEWLPPDKPYGEQLADATGMKANPKDTLDKYIGSIGETVGNPSSYFGPGGFLSKLFMGTMSGAGSEAAGEAAEGTGFEGPARIIGGMAAGPLAARALKPQLAAPQQALADRGVTQMTPGQLAGGLTKDFEDKLTSVPILGHFIQNSRGRSIDSFNRSVANQALEPIGETLNPRTAVGHDTISEVHDKVSAAYDNLVPQLQLRPDQQWFRDLRNIYDRNVDMLPQEQIQQYQKIIDQRLGLPAPLNGEKVKNIESQLTYLAGKYGKSSDGAHQLLGDALQDTVTALRQNLERMNPGHADELRQINTAYAMYVRMAEAAANRRTSGGTFTPSDLLAGIKRQDKSVRKGSFARGDAMMQDFAEAGQQVLPSKIPDSGTAGRSLAAIVTGGGLGYLSPKVLAGVGAASLPYNSAAMNLLNRYTRATPQSPGRIARARANYSNVGRGAGMLRPLLQGQPNGPY
jgi:hypothetical protein